jgi:hypothetical protein
LPLLDCKDCEIFEGYKRGESPDMVHIWGFY